MSLRKKLFDDEWKLSRIIFTMTMGVLSGLICAGLVPIIFNSDQTPAEVGPTFSSEPSLTPSSSLSEASPTLSTSPTASSSATPTFTTPSDFASPSDGSIFLTDMDELDSSYWITTGHSVEIGGELFI